MSLAACIQLCDALKVRCGKVAYIGVFPSAFPPKYILLFFKSRVVLLRTVTVPRVPQVSTRLAVRVHCALDEETQIEFDEA